MLHCGNGLPFRAVELIYLILTDKIRFKFRVLRPGIAIMLRRRYRKGGARRGIWEHDPAMSLLQTESPLEVHSTTTLTAPSRKGGMPKPQGLLP
jgi:hypothetical protein